MNLSKTLRGLAFGALAATVTLGSVSAQNGTNFHVLTNEGDFFYSGVGTGGGQTFNDGIGTFIAGEDMRGSHMTSLGEFGYRMTGFREAVCKFGIGPIVLNLMMVELDGGTGASGNGFGGNNPAVFTNPACTFGASFPLNGSAGFVPYGTGPASSFSFLLTLLPAFGLPSGHLALLPDNGLINSANGTATIVVAGAGVSVGGAALASGCYIVQLGFTASAVPFLDNIDGVWHYLWNTSTVNQAPIFSGDEMNLWHSLTVGTDAGSTALIGFLAQTDYELVLMSIEPQTIATLAPRGLDPFTLTLAAGPYYTQTAGVANENGIPLNPLGGFDIGRGSSAISFSGTAGVMNIGTGLGVQHPTNNTPAIASGTLGFATWDNGGDQNGSVRLTWVSVDFLGAGGLDPALDPGAVLFGGTIRVPVVSAGLLQPVTNLCFGLFGHTTANNGWLDPNGLPNGAIGVTSFTGASWQLPTGPQPAACASLPFGLNLTYGTSSRLDGPGGLNWNPAIGDTSGTKQLFLFD